MSDWQPISTAPQNVKVLAAYRNRLGNWRIVTACYHTMLPWNEDYIDEREDETEYAPERWYEESESQEVIYPTDCDPTHWAPLPSPPLTEEQQ